MKWYKHLSGSLKDSVIFEAIEIFGSDAYLVFFGTLELMADEFDIHNPGTVRLSLKKMTSFLQLSRQKTVRILQHFDQKAKEKPQENISFFATIEKDHVVIKCPRLADLCDNHTQQLLRETSKSDRIKSEVTFPVEGEGEGEGDKEPKDTLKEEPWPLSSEQIQEASDILIGEWLDGLSRYLEQDIFPEAVRFKTSMLSNGNNYNRRAVLHALNQLLKKKKRSSKPWPYCLKILTVENGNYNERDAVKSHR